MVQSASPGSDSNETLELLLEAVDRSDSDSIARFLSTMHCAQIADALESTDSAHRYQLWQPLDAARKGQVLLSVHTGVRHQLVQQTPESELVQILDTLEADEQADLDDELPDAVIARMISNLTPERRQQYEAVRQYPDDTAGGLMDVDAIIVRPDITLQAVQRYLRRRRSSSKQLPELLETLAVTDRENRFLGALQLSDIVSLPATTLVADAMGDDRPALNVGLSAEKVAQLFADQDLLSATVVDDDNRVLGRITIDDVVDVISERAERKELQRVGLPEGTDLFSPLISTAGQRAIWIGVNLINGLVAAAIIGLFEQSIEKLVALAVLMPMVASMGGVTGNQTFTLVARGLALDQISRTNTGRLLRRELTVGLINGIVWASLVASVAALWFDNWNLGLVFGAAMVINMLTGAFAGTVVPVWLHRIGIDPALAGGVLLMAATDVVGFASFLGLASMLLL